MSLTLNEAAALLGTNARGVQEWIDREGLPAVRVHAELRVPREGLFDWLSLRGRVVPQGLLRPGRGPELALLVRAMEAGTTAHNGPVAEPHAAAIALLSTLPGTASGAELAKLVAVRPGLGFAPLGDGIALPRLHAPLVVEGPPIVSLCTFAAPPLPGLEARVFVVVAAPTVHVHGALLEALHQALRARGLRALVAAGSPLHELASALLRDHPRAAAAR